MDISEDSKCGETGGWTELRGHMLVPEMGWIKESKQNIKHVKLNIIWGAQHQAVWFSLSYLWLQPTEGMETWQVWRSWRGSCCWCDPENKSDREKRISLSSSILVILQSIKSFTIQEQPIFNMHYTAGREDVLLSSSGSLRSWFYDLTWLLQHNGAIDELP